VLTSCIVARMDKCMLQFNFDVFEELDGLSLGRVGSSKFDSFSGGHRERVR
jgi:hypothetical protein